MGLRENQAPGDLKGIWDCLDYLDLQACPESRETGENLVLLDPKENRESRDRRAHQETRE